MILGEGNKVIVDNKILGFFVENKNGFDFVTPRKSVHKFRMYDSWGMNAELVKELNEVGVSTIRVVVDGGKRVLISTPSNWLTRGISYQSSKFEPQLQLRETDFEKVFE